MKSIMCFFFLNAYLSLGQCWESLDTSTGDTSTNNYIIRKDGTLWSLPTTGLPYQMNSSKTWKSCFKSGSSSGVSVFVIAKDSTLWGFGANYSGQLGIGSSISFQANITQLNSSKWIDITSAQGFTIAVKSDGTLWFWGQFGFNNPVYIPIQIGNFNA